ncbi:hypothetical protein [Streptomyces erythrochromogenes]|uniref:hypothetical protein n=1 Tax=Streptomyces erythrochromogenes TaxID=285574 RepID=UPI0037F4FDEE
MTLHIDGIDLVTPGVGPLVGYAVLTYTRSASGPVPKGDLVGAIGAGTAVATALFLLFGGDGRQPAAPEPQPSGRTLSASTAGAPSGRDPASGTASTPPGAAPGEMDLTVRRTAE